MKMAALLLADMLGPPDGEAVTPVAVSMARVNGPQDDDFDWDSISWATIEDDVRRLRQRIFKAS
ncbi:hypothetical protein [Arthrobacter sp. STN4]|uniref:hypothetical protein n=1 Tax=Arthrobacter sp. STN4 TaxID=2923276 RepID=UPI00211A983F|nr:hypothetical protein [Arthrobacter sp. STN4]MCQ9164241.1 hypothetical protein [Arthrobacter sp. STN4]